MSSNVLAMRRPQAPHAPARPVRVLLADGEWLTRTGVRAILDADDGIDVVATAPDRETALLHLSRLRPDVVVVAARLNAIPSLAALACGPARVLLVTESEGDQHVLRALRAGAAGSVPRSADARRVAEAVRTIAAGGAFLPPHIARALAAGAVDAEQRADAQMRRRFALLSERELEVVCLLARGMSNAEIADELYLSEGTVKTYVTRTLGKLRLRSRVQVVVAAFDAGLVRPQQRSLVS